MRVHKFIIMFCIVNWVFLSEISESLEIILFLSSLFILYVIIFLIAYRFSKIKKKNFSNKIKIKNRIFSIADFYLRLIAFVFDAFYGFFWVITLPFIYIISLYTGMNWLMESPIILPFSLFYMTLIYFLCFFISEYRDSTFGYKLQKLAVLRDNGEELNLNIYILRNIFRALLIMTIVYPVAITFMWEINKIFSIILIFIIFIIAIDIFYVVFDKMDRRLTDKLLKIIIIKTDEPTIPSIIDLY